MNPNLTKGEVAMLANIVIHYRHAKKKHPYFCDRLLPISAEGLKLQDALPDMRRELREDIERGECAAFSVAGLELLEFAEAVILHDTAASVEECYDTIAVLLRTIDVLEGRQKLGK